MPRNNKHSSLIVPPPRFVVDQRLYSNIVLLMQEAAHPVLMIQRLKINRATQGLTTETMHELPFAFHENILSTHGENFLFCNLMRTHCY
mmetsp:Transcript_37091/g.111098  ORF Transcript_37091/g.111098 Transcript_37091/m.111098 type:complete len:89 (-) Transcript_37091:1229-1495(-)